MAFELINHSVTKDYDTTNSLYFEFALYELNHDREFFQYLQESTKFRLYCTLNAGVPMHVIIRTDCCDECNKHEAEVYTIEEVLEKMPLPHRECNHVLNNKKGWCRCCYTFKRVESY